MGVDAGGGEGWSAALVATSRATGRATNLATIRAETEATFARASANPATPSVYNEGLLTQVMRHEANAGREVGLVLGDLNNLSEFNDSQGPAGGDKAIDEASAVFNRAATALNRLPAGEEVWALPGRKGGDEMYVLVGRRPAPAVDPVEATRIPLTVVRDAVRVVNDEVAAFNAQAAVPIPTCTTVASIIRPDQHADAFSLSSLLDRIDSMGVRHVNDPATAASWRKNAGALVTDAVLSGAVPEVLPGPIYTLPPEAQMPGFRTGQGGFARQATPFQTGLPNVVAVTPEGAAARPWLLPGAAATPTDGRVGLPQHLVERLAHQDADPVANLNRLRGLEPIESVFRPLLAEGIRVYNQPVGLARLDHMLTASEPGQSLSLEYMELRGLKDINDRAFVLVDEQPVKVSHGGGNRAMDEGMRATHQALERVLGPGYDDRGDAFLFRDRTKRVGVVYGPSVSREAIEAVQLARSAILRATPAEVRVGGTEYPVRMPNGGPEGRPLVYRVAAVAVRLEPRAPGLEFLTAATLREMLVAPPYEGGQSALELAKVLIDGGAVPGTSLPSPGPGMELVIMTEKRIRSDRA